MIDVTPKEIIAHSIFAIMGGLSYVIQNRTDTWVSRISNWFIATFTGVTVGVLAFQVIGDSHPLWALGITGLAGNMGPPMLLAIASALKKLIVDKLNSLGKKK